jgi:hypothetical protein
MTSEKEKRGRPATDISWQYVDKLLQADCSGTEIAARLGIKPANLYDRCWTDNGILFSEYSQEKKAKGDSILREVQFSKALAGDNTLLIWLGKCRLRQSDPSLSNQNNAQKIIVEVKGNGLASGVDVSTSSVSDTDNQSSK